MRAVLFVALSLLSLGAVSAQQTCAGLEIGRIYTATSPLTVATLTANNWTLCAMVPFDVSVSPDIPQFRIPACSQFSHLIIGCRATNAPALTVAAGAPYATIFTESPPTSAGNIVGSASFYYTTGFSMGFAPAGQPVDRDQCDKFDSTANNRLCYEMVAAGGRDGRCGAGANIGPSKNVFRVAYGFNCPPPTDPCVAEQVHFKPCTRTRLVSEVLRDFECLPSSHVSEFLGPFDQTHTASFNFVANGGVDCVAP